MIEHELHASANMRTERKRTSLIASLVNSLQVDEKLEATKPEEEKKGLSRTEVMNEMLAFLAAGYGTTLTSLIWFTFYMSKNPHIQKKIKEELAECDGQRFSSEQLDSFVYLECSQGNLTIGSTNISNDLNEFHPERFLNDPEHKNNLAALMAFVGGHRQWMGQD